MCDLSKCDSESLDSHLLYAWGDESHIRVVQKRYIRYFHDAPGPVLDIGCARGIMLDLLKTAGVWAYGVDVSNESVKMCHDRGLNALQGNAIDHLATLQDNSIGGLFCSHVIEHMQPSDALNFIGQCRRVMKPGARIILVTPDAADLRTSERFWLDLTHVRPYPKKLLMLLLQRAGFSVLKVTADKEPSSNILIKIAKLFLRIWFMGFMFRGDLVVIAERDK